MIVIRMRHALMNMSGFTVHMSRMLNLRWSWQTLRQGAVCKRESDRRDETKGIERNENARSLYPQDSGQLRQHPEIGTPVVAISHDPSKEVQSEFQTGKTLSGHSNARKISVHCLISHSGSDLRGCIAGPIWTKAFGRRSK